MSWITSARESRATDAGGQHVVRRRRIAINSPSSASYIAPDNIFSRSLAITGTRGG